LVPLSGRSKPGWLVPCSIEKAKKKRQKDRLAVSPTDRLRLRSRPRLWLRVCARPARWPQLWLLEAAPPRPRDPRPPLPPPRVLLTSGGRQRWGVKRCQTDSSYDQCCGYGMFIPAPGSEFCPVRIQDPNFFHTGSRFAFKN
jgi:hypothetical protein